MVVNSLYTIKQLTILYRSKRMRIALIPAYQPEPILIDIVQSLKSAGLQIIVVDDGSGAPYAPIFKAVEKSAVLLAYSQNAGKGHALKTGLRYINDNFEEPYTVVTLDADGQHHIPDALRVCDAAEQHPDSLVLGSRLMQKNAPLRSRFGNSLTRFVFRLVTHMRIYDTQTGLRAFSQKLLPFLSAIHGDRYEYEMNVLLEASREKIPMTEIAISTIYIDANAGSHFNALRDSAKIYREIFAFSLASKGKVIKEIGLYALSSFVCFAIDYGLYSAFIVLFHSFNEYTVVISNICARIISACINFTINRKLVFRSRESLLKSAAYYAMLAAMILLGNTLVLSLLSNQLHINKCWAKLITEFLFFIVSWFVQRTVIFGRKKPSP